MLEGATAIPYSDGLITLLEDTCLTYKSDTVLERVDELTVGFVTSNIPSKFKSHINEAMEKQGFDEIPTEDVFLQLAQYVVLNTILENNDKEEQAICASKLMNYMIVAKATKRSIPNTKSLLKVYSYHISKYLEELDNIQGEIKTDICSVIPNATFPLEITEEEADDVRLVFKESEMYRIERQLTSDRIQSITNPFVRVYVGLCDLFERLTYCYYNLDLKRIIGLLISTEEEKKRKTLSKIIEDLLRADCKFTDDCNETSVILQMIKGKNLGAVGDLMLPIKEFAVYLYYELLTETIIVTRN